MPFPCYTWGMARHEKPRRGNGRKHGFSMSDNDHYVKSGSFFICMRPFLHVETEAESHAESDPETY